MKAQLDRGVQMLEKLIKKMEKYQDAPYDAYMNGYNSGLDQAITLVKHEIQTIKGVKEEQEV